MIAPEAINCGAPDTGNMETLMLFGTDDQKQRWLQPLLEGEIRSGFAMTEPDVASSDARNIQTSIVRDGDDYVINGRKWWTSGAADERCQIFIVMGKTDPDGAPHNQQSMVLVPRDTPGLEIIRHLPVFGYQDQHGHSELRFTDVRVPRTNILAGEGDGFMIAQARLGPGRIHHCMRAIGMAERALALMVERAKARVAFGRPLAEQGTVRESIALSRIEIDSARLLVLKTADLIDKFGAKGARTEISVDQGRRTEGRPRRHRPGDPDPRRRRRQRRHPAGRASTRTPARCGSSTAPTRCTSAASPRRSSTGSAPTAPERRRPFSGRGPVGYNRTGRITIRSRRRS